MARQNWIAYLGPFKFPFGQAASRRVLGIALSLVHAEYNVIIGSGELTPVTPLLYKAGKHTLSYVGLGELPPNNAPFITKSKQWFWDLGDRTIHWLNQQPTKPSHVIVYGTQVPMMLKLIKWCHRNRVSLIVDVVEWYDPWHVLGGPLGPLNLSIKTAMSILVPRSNGIIAISSYLKSYYQKRGCQVIRIPPTLDLQELETKRKMSSFDQRLNLVYAGTPGKKDRIDNVMQALMQLDFNGDKVLLQIAGPTKKEILDMSIFRNQGISKLPSCIEAHGLLAHADVMNLVRNADFVPLLRPAKRYADAGFPTKVVESLALGTPIIGNLTSDLSEYINDGKEGLVCQDHSTQSFIDTLERALRLTPQERLAMQIAARSCAERSFDYRVYVDSLSSFIQDTMTFSS